MKTCLWLAPLLGAWVLAGCGGGDGNLLGTTRAEGNVVLSDFPAGGLTVSTIQQEGVAVGSDGSFQVEVAGDTPQLVMLENAAGQTVGLGTLKRGIPARIDAESTALALLYLAPGLTPLNNETRVATEAALRSLPEFASFVNLLEGTLTDGELAEMSANVELRTAYEAVINKMIPVLPTTSPIDGPWPDYANGVTITANAANMDAVDVKFVNESWRDLSVITEGRKLSGPVVSDSIVPIEGPEYSLGSSIVGIWNIFHGDPPISTESRLPLDMKGNDGYAEANLWLIGIGAAPGESLPSHLPANLVLKARARAGIVSVVRYVAQPFLTYVGITDAAPRLDALMESTEVVQQTVSLMDAMADGMSSEDTAALADYAKFLGDKILDDEIARAGSNSSLLRKLQHAKRFLGWIFATFDATNFGMAANYYSTSPPNVKVKLVAKGDVEVEVR